MSNARQRRSTAPAPASRLRQRRGGRAGGFTLVEVLVALALTLVIVGAALTASHNARRASDLGLQLLELNGALRTGTDMMVRDLLQAGEGLQGLPGKAIEKPNGGGAGLVKRPGPGNRSFPAGDLTFPAVIAGASLGPAFTEPGSGQQAPTDMVTTLSVDSEYDGVECRIEPNGRILTVPPPSGGHPNGRDISGPGVDDPLLAGDLILVTGSEAGSGSALVEITSVNGQSIHLDADDPMNVNQVSGTDGTIMQLLKKNNGGNYIPTNATLSRVRMITYYVDTGARPPRLMRQLNFRVAQAVAMGIDNLQLTYDLSDGTANPTNIKAPTIPNQIRKVNLYLSARSRRPEAATGQLLRSSIATQIALRSLAFVDRYR